MDTEFFENWGVDMDVDTEIFKNRGVNMDTAWNRCPPNSDSKTDVLMSGPMMPDRSDHKWITPNGNLWSNDPGNLGVLHSVKLTSRL